MSKIASEEGLNPSTSKAQEGQVPTARVSEKDARISAPFLLDLKEAAKKDGFAVWVALIQVAGRKVEIHEIITKKNKVSKMSKVVSA